MARLGAFSSAPTLQEGHRPLLLGDAEVRPEVASVRAAYLQHLAQDRLVQGGYVPDLVPILTWNEPAGSCSSPTMTPPAGRSRDMLDSPRTAEKSFLRPGSMRSSVVNITAAALGAGALALPRAMYYSGIFWGPVLMLFLAALSVLSIRMVVQLVELTGRGSYEELPTLGPSSWSEPEDIRGGSFR
ncbi:Vacuolar amino acid transporter 2, partial [Durusdinium trenchii]